MAIAIRLIFINSISKERIAAALQYWEDGTRSVTEDSSAEALRVALRADEGVGPYGNTAGPFYAIHGDESSVWPAGHPPPLKKEALLTGKRQVLRRTAAVGAKHSALWRANRALSIEGLSPPEAQNWERV